MILAILGAAIVVLVLWDAFQAIVVPKTVSRQVSISSIYAMAVWRLWHGLVDRLPEGRARHALLVSFGPMALLFLFVAWSGVLVASFALILFGVQTLGPEGDYLEALYMSGVTFFTLGFGDVVPQTGLGRFLAVVEAGTGFGFLAVVIGYVPTLYQSFSRRERFIVLLDSRAGSDPSACELLRRHFTLGTTGQLAETLQAGEVWAAEQLEVYLSHPILAYYRSQHDTQSWLKTITAILDACALILACKLPEDEAHRKLRFQAQATFAMSRHVIVDLAYLLGDAPANKPFSRLAPTDLEALRETLALGGWDLDAEAEQRLEQLTALYEPYLVGLAIEMHFSVPAWRRLDEEPDNWERTAWDDKPHF